MQRSNHRPALSSKSRLLSSSVIKYIVGGLGFIVIAIVLIMKTLSKFDSNMGVNHILIVNSDINKNVMRVISVHNDYGFDVALFYDDGQDGITSNGVYISKIAAGQSNKVSAETGNKFYATEIDDYDHKVAMIIINDHSNMYEIRDHLSSITSKHSNHSSLMKQSVVTLNAHQFTRVHPSVKSLGGVYTTAMAAKFRNLSSRKLKFFYDDGGKGIEQGHLSPGQETTTNTYQGHVFFFTLYHNEEVEIMRFTMDLSKSLYLVTDPSYPADQSVIDLSNKEEIFMKEYYEKNGILWRHYFGPDGPRPPPMLYMWPASSVGQVHEVTTSQGYWSCDGHASKCQAREQITLSLEVVSLEPRAFVINNFLSDFEVDEIIRHATPHLSKSQVGEASTGISESSTRSSSNTWMQRTSSAITETLFLRAADLLQIDEEKLKRQQCAEDIQVVHYEIGQKYDAHHDWGVSGYPQSRFITLLLYLTDMPDPTAGGETAFPKGDGGVGFKIHPGKGNAVLFYNLLPDGNGDDLALHAALPVRHGEKWLANFWVWDPKQSRF